MVFNYQQFHRAPTRIVSSDFQFPVFDSKKSPENIYPVAHKYYHHLIKNNIPEKEAWSQAEQTILKKYRNNIDGLGMSLGLFKEIINRMHSQTMSSQETITKDVLQKTITEETFQETFDKDALLRSRTEANILENVLYREDY